MKDITLSELFKTIDSATIHPSSRSGTLINCQLLYLLSGMSTGWSAVSTITSAICANKSNAKIFIFLFTHTRSLFTSHLFLPNSFFKKKKEKRKFFCMPLRCLTLFQTLSPRIFSAFGSSLLPYKPGDVFPKAGLQISVSKGGKGEKIKSLKPLPSPEPHCPVPSPLFLSKPEAT